MAGDAASRGRSSTASSAACGMRWAGTAPAGSGGAAGGSGSGVRGLTTGGGWGGALAVARLIIAERAARCASAKPSAGVFGGCEPDTYAGTRNPLLDSPLTWRSCPFPDCSSWSSPLGGRHLRRRGSPWNCPLTWWSCPFPGWPPWWSCPFPGWPSAGRDPFPDCSSAGRDPSPDWPPAGRDSFPGWLVTASGSVSVLAWRRRRHSATIAGLIGGWRGLVTGWARIAR